MNVLILHTAPPEAVAPGRRVWEFDLQPAAQGIAEVLPGAHVAQVRGEPREILALLDAHAPDVVFNLCEAPLGRAELEPHVAALFEWAGVRFTGSGSETLALCRRKDRVTAVLASMGVPIPREGPFPCVVKPADQDGSAGIDHDSICEDERALARVRARIDGPVVIQEFLPGREFVVSLWGGAAPEHVSIGETLFQAGLRLNTYAAKWDIESVDFANSPLSYELDLDDGLREAIVAAARGAWRAVGARGYVRVDVRLDNAGEPRVLDVNPNPEIAPEVGIYRAVVEAGWTWERFVRAQLAWA
jgi:D-alanine-D-alanine ligase